MFADLKACNHEEHEEHEEKTSHLRQIIKACKTMINVDQTIRFCFSFVLFVSFVVHAFDLLLSAVRLF